MDTNLLFTVTLGIVSPWAFTRALLRRRGGEKIDCSRLVQVGDDETSVRKRHHSIKCFLDMMPGVESLRQRGREHQNVAACERFVSVHSGDAYAVRDMSPAFQKGIRGELAQC